MFVQVFIELDRRYQRSMVTVHLYFWGVQNLKFKYRDALMKDLSLVTVDARSFEIIPLQRPAATAVCSDRTSTRQNTVGCSWGTLAAVAATGCNRMISVGLNRVVTRQPGIFLKQNQDARRSWRAAPVTTPMKETRSEMGSNDLANGQTHF